MGCNTLVHVDHPYSVHFYFYFYTLFILVCCRSEGKGVMVPPVLVDVNKDGVRDILMNSFNGVMILYDGETLAPLWKIELENRESYR